MEPPGRAPGQSPPYAGLLADPRRRHAGSPPPAAGRGRRWQTAPRGRLVDRAHVLPIDLLHRDPEGGGASGDTTSGHLAGGRVLAVLVVLADVDNGQLPERRHVHRLVEQPLAERAVAEEADRYLV